MFCIYKDQIRFKKILFIIKEIALYNLLNIKLFFRKTLQIGIGLLDKNILSKTKLKPKMEIINVFFFILFILCAVYTLFFSFLSLHLNIFLLFLKLGYFFAGEFVAEKRN